MNITYLRKSHPQNLTQWTFKARVVLISLAGIKQDCSNSGEQAKEGWWWCVCVWGGIGPFNDRYNVKNKQD